MYMYTKLLSDERLGAKLRVTENRCVIFNRSTHVYVYIYIYIFIYMCVCWGGMMGTFLRKALEFEGQDDQRRRGSHKWRRRARALVWRKRTPWMGVREIATGVNPATPIYGDKHRLKLDWCLCNRQIDYNEEHSYLTSFKCIQWLVN